MRYFTSEIASNSECDLPIHLRIETPYKLIAPLLHGRVLELGCGWGRGVDVLSREKRIEYHGVDKNKQLISLLQKQYPACTFDRVILPDLSNYADSSFDFVICFQVIEHLKEDQFLLEEIKRVLKPNGVLYLSTVNRKQTIVRNPWHYREYSCGELKRLLLNAFDEVDIKGVIGNETVNSYMQENRKQVAGYLKFDILGMHKILPSFLLRVPYDLANRFNRNRLNKQLYEQITQMEYSISDNTENALDFFVICRPF